MAEDLTAALSAGERAEVSYELTQTTLTAPVSAGTQVGEAVYYVNSVELARVPLVTGKTVPCDLAEPSSLLGKIWERITGL